MKVRHAAWFLGLLAPLALHAQQPAPKPSTLSKADYIAAAMKAAPASISDKAAIIRLEKGGRATMYRTGTNGFTCLFGLPGDPEEAPLCGDANAVRWLRDAMSGKPRPTNTVAGIAYMAEGGTHYVNAAGESVMEPGPGTKVVKEPPHWMVFSPFDPKTTGLPTRPVNNGGAWIMFAGTPYAHLMVYQDPAKLLAR